MIHFFQQHEAKKSKLQLYTKNPEHIFGMPGIGRKVVSEDADLDVKQLDHHREER